jgi:hypothetical protein
MNPSSYLSEALADMIGVAAICAVTIAVLWLPAVVG